MSYLNDFQKLISNKDLPKLLELWEEYCTNDKADVPEFIAFLKMMKKSELASSFGQYIEMALSLWQTIENLDESYEVMKHLIDLQTTNSEVLAEAAFQVLKAKHSDDPGFHDKLRLVGLRTRDQFQGAISNYDLLSHINKGKFVYHTGGWGCGEIMDYSDVREQIGVEFENVPGLKYFTFGSAFKTLEPLSEGNFLVKRFGDPDRFEEESKKNPVTAIKLLLRDLGPKTAAEIKDEMCELVIPEQDWVKWWQNARVKLKKDPFIDAPKNVKDCFYLRKTEITHEEMLEQELHAKQDEKEVILSAYTLIRDVPKTSQNKKIYEAIEKKLKELMETRPLSSALQLQVMILFEQFLGQKVEGKEVQDLIKESEDIEDIVSKIDVIALKKRVLLAIKKFRKEWVEIFTRLLFTEQTTPIRDYIFSEIQSEELFYKKFEELRHNPIQSPDTVLWYFQKLVANKHRESIPYGNKQGECEWFEALLMVLSQIENDSNYKELTKKIEQTISANHYAAIRYIFEGSTKEVAEEILLLLSKCMIYGDSEQKIFLSLAQVAHPSIAGKTKHREKLDQDLHIFWATEESYVEARKKAQHIGTVEIVENAEEVKKARELGDLRENAEYKAACERRRRLQHDLRLLSDQINRARVITIHDIDSEKVGIGSMVTLKGSDGKEKEYTILGTWDADVEKGILSIQSRFAQAMLNKKIGDVFTFGEEEYTVCGLKSYLAK